MSLAAPPHTPSTQAVLAGARTKPQKQAPLPGKPDAERQAAQQWVERLIRRELGRALASAEKDGPKLAIKLSVPTANLLSKALKRKAESRRAK